MPDLSILPHSIEAEEALIGSILIEPDGLGEIIMPPEAFYLVKHQWVWRAFLDLYARHDAIDLLTVQESLSKQGQLSEIGGPAYLTRLVTLTPTAYNATSYARLVDEAYQRRRLIASAQEVARLSFDSTEGIESVKSASMKAINNACDGGIEDTLTGIDRPAADLMERVSENTLGVRLLKTGIAPLDNNIGGLNVDTLTILAGRPGMSKTSLLVQIADLVSERGELVAVFSKEMSRDQWLLRMACRRARVPVQSLYNGTASYDDRSIVAQWLGDFTNRKTLHIDEKKSQTTVQVMAECRKLERRKGGIALVVADHLRLFDDKHSNEVKRLGIISRQFKVISGELKTRSLLAAQLNRGPESRPEEYREPTMADIRGSGEIEEDADNIFGLYRPDYYARTGTDKTVKIISLKLRDGDVLPLTVMDFEASYMSFERKAVM